MIRFLNKLQEAFNAILVAVQERVNALIDWTKHQLIYFNWTNRAPYRARIEGRLHASVRDNYWLKKERAQLRRVIANMRVDYTKLEERLLQHLEKQKTHVLVNLHPEVVKLPDLRKPTAEVVTR